MTEPEKPRTLADIMSDHLDDRERALSWTAFRSDLLAWGRAERRAERERCAQALVAFGIAQALIRNLPDVETEA